MLSSAMLTTKSFTANRFLAVSFSTPFFRPMLIAISGGE